MPSRQARFTIWPFAIRSGYFAGPSSGYASASFGYIICFVVCAALCGFLAERRADRRLLTSVPAMLAGEMIGGYSLSEPQAGSDAAALRCKAEKVTHDGRHGYRVTGTKAWITHGGVADFYALFARTGAGSRGFRGLMTRRHTYICSAPAIPRRRIPPDAAMETICIPARW